MLKKAIQHVKIEVSVNERQYQQYVVMITAETQGF